VLTNIKLLIIFTTFWSGSVLHCSLLHSVIDHGNFWTQMKLLGHARTNQREIRQQQKLHLKRNQQKADLIQTAQHFRC